MSIAMVALVFGLGYFARLALNKCLHIAENRSAERFRADECEQRRLLLERYFLIARERPLTREEHLVATHTPVSPHSCSTIADVISPITSRR